jgi:hypothetical protein
VRRKKKGTRGVTRDPAAMDDVVAACSAAIRDEAGGQTLAPSRMRSALVLCLRERFSCTLEQIGKVVDLSAERVRQLYQDEKRARGRHARAARAPVEELSPRARQGLADVGLAPGASMHDVTRLLPLLRASAGAPHDNGLSSNLRLHLLDRETLGEIEEWLHRHGVPFR